MNFFVQFVLKFMTAGEDKFDNSEQLYQEKFLVLSGTSGLSLAQRLSVQTIVSN